ncbi:hypothetical protein QTP88_018489 [Uroleucon formosanum]
MGPVKYKCLSIADKKKVIAAVVEAGEKKRCCSTFWYSSFYAFNDTYSNKKTIFSDHTRQSTFQQDKNQTNIYQEPISKAENHSILQLLTTSKPEHLSNFNTINTINIPSPSIPQTNQTFNNQNFYKQDSSTDSLT